MYIHLNGTLVVQRFVLRALFSLKIIHKPIQKQNEKYISVWIQSKTLENIFVWVGTEYKWFIEDKNNNIMCLWKWLKITYETKYIKTKNAITQTHRNYN